MAFKYGKHNRSAGQWRSYTRVVPVQVLFAVYLQAAAHCDIACKTFTIKLSFKRKAHSPGSILLGISEISVVSYSDARCRGYHGPLQDVKPKVTWCLYCLSDLLLIPQHTLNAFWQRISCQQACRQCIAALDRLCFIFSCYGFKFLPESLLYWPAFFIISLRPLTWIRKRSGYQISTQNFQYSLGLFDSISMLQQTLTNKTYFCKVLRAIHKLFHCRPGQARRASWRLRLSEFLEN